MTPPLLTRNSLGRVLQSLITHTLSSHRPTASKPLSNDKCWADDFLIMGSHNDALGCDSLDLLQISAAVNEMFHLHEAGLETELLSTASFGEWLTIIERAWQRGVTHLTVTTSGSTSIPKHCTHEFSKLMIEMDFLAELFGQRSRIVAFTPAHHLYGLLFTAMLPDRIACPVRDFLSPDSPTDSGPVKLQAGDLVVSFPQGWQWIDRSVRTMPADVEGAVSTAPCPLELIESLVPGKLSALTEIYGSSETSGIGTRRWPAKTYSLMPQWKRTSSGQHARKSLWHTAGFQVEPMDHLEFSADGTFLVRGRIDSVVQVGGVNVFPERIAERLKTHPEVAEASVRLMRPDEGSRLKCFVVPQSNDRTAILPMLLGEWIESWPIAAERPKNITIGSALPRSGSGKGIDWL